MVNVLPLLLFISNVFFSYADDFGLDPTVFSKLVNDEKEGSPKEDIFLSHMWPIITQFFPTETVIPAVEVEYKEETKDTTTDKGNQVSNDQEHSGQGEKNNADQGEAGHVSQGEAVTTGQGDSIKSERRHKVQDNAKEKEKSQKLEAESYSCQTEAKLSMKLDVHEQKTYKELNGKNKKAKLEVVAQLKIDQPIFFDVVVKTHDIEKPFVPTKMKYLFSGNNKVKISMVIPDFSENQKVTAECLVIVTGIEAIKFDEPDCSGSEVTDEYLIQDENFAKQIPIEYFRYMETTGRFYEAMTAGLTKAFIEKVKKLKEKDGMFKVKEKKTWICISDEFKRKEPHVKQRFTYGEQYNTICNGVKAS